jgi:hypothetical protein
MPFIPLRQQPCLGPEPGSFLWQTLMSVCLFRRSCPAHVSGCLPDPMMSPPPGAQGPGALSPGAPRPDDGCDPWVNRCAAGSACVGFRQAAPRGTGAGKCLRATARFVPSYSTRLRQLPSCISDFVALLHLSCSPFSTSPSGSTALDDAPLRPPHFT